MKKEVYFREVQNFHRIVCGLLVLDTLVLNALLFYLIYCLACGRTVKLPVTTAGIMLVAPLLVTVLLQLCQLETEVWSDGLYVRFFPFHLRFRRFTFAQIHDYYAREYEPVSEYAGRGIRWGLCGRSYNISGRYGVEMVLADGRRVLVGSQLPEKLVAAMDLAAGREI